MTSIWKNNRGLLIIAAVTVVLLAGVLQSMEPKVWMSIMLSGATLAALYFLVASGLSLIFGLMDVLNFAHGVLFVLGAYVGLSTFMNPRLLFNTLPFFFVLIATISLAQQLGRHFWHRVNTARGRQKDRNMRRNERVTVLAIDPENAFRELVHADPPFLVGVDGRGNPAQQNTQKYHQQATSLLATSATRFPR